MKKYCNKNVKRGRLCSKTHILCASVLLYLYTKRRHALKNRSDSWKNLIRRSSLPLVIIVYSYSQSLSSDKDALFSSIPESIIKRVHAHSALSTMSRIRIQFYANHSQNVTYCFVKLLISIPR